MLLNGRIAATLSTDGVTHADFTYADGYLNDRAADVWVYRPVVGAYNDGTITYDEVLAVTIPRFQE